MYDKCAVVVQNANKSYGKNKVLENLNMTVDRGSIYGLLGASGCGKTTLLQTIVCCKRLDSGDIWVLGEKPGSEKSGLPGPGVGYMPQEVALCGEFTVKDAVYYFSRLYEMEDDLIEERFKYFAELLDLPPGNRYIRNCSGGQQRRVSFIAAVIHKPELLILDEPTAGVDSMLREKIWNYLLDLVEKHNTAVIITTHYIEEARHSNKVGLMRKGRILAEESPNKLIARYHAESLEHVFLILSERQEQEAGIVNKAFGSNMQLGDVDDTSQHVQEQRIEIVDETRPPASDGLYEPATHSIHTDESNNQDRLNIESTKQKIYKRSTVKLSRIKALMGKNLKQFYRNITVVLFSLVMPPCQTVFFLLAIGRDVQDIPLGIVNGESMLGSCNMFDYNTSAMFVSLDECNFTNASCRFLSYLEDPMIKKRHYGSLEEAMTAARSGKVAGVLYMGQNFTAAFQTRFDDGSYSDEETVEFGEIKVWLDMSNRQIAMSLKGKLLKKYIDFQKDLFNDCHVSPKAAQFPVNFKALFGDLEEEFINFMIPAVILLLAFAMAAQLTTQIVVTERCEGVWERSAVAGVTSLEITLTHLILQSLVVFIQVTSTIVVVFVIYQYECLGSLYLFTGMAYLQGLAGLVFGFWISVISTSHIMSNLITTAIFFMTMVSCGMLWPIEGMPTILQWISKTFPFTIAIEAGRNIMRKGWSIYDPGVWIGNGIACVWIVVFAAMSVLALRRK